MKQDVKQMRKITAVLLITSTLLGLFPAIPCSGFCQQRMNILTTRRRVPHQLCLHLNQGSFLQRVKLYSMEIMQQLGFILTEPCQRVAAYLMLREQSFLSHYQSGNLERAAAIAVELEQLGSETESCFRTCPERCSDQS